VPRSEFLVGSAYLGSVPLPRQPLDICACWQERANEVVGPGMKDHSELYIRNEWQLPRKFFSLMRRIYLSIVLSLTCMVAGAQDNMQTATASSWSDFVVQTIKFLKKTDESRVVQNKDVTIYQSGTPWSFEMDPDKRLYSIAVLYLPRFAPAPTVSFSYRDGTTVYQDKDFAKVEDKVYGAKFLNVKPGQHNLGRLTMAYNGRSESSSVTVIIVAH
jgi:hypothetical protein